MGNEPPFLILYLKKSGTTFFSTIRGGMLATERVVTNSCTTFMRKNLFFVENFFNFAVSISINQTFFSHNVFYSSSPIYDVYSKNLVSCDLNVFRSFYEVKGNLFGVFLKKFEPFDYLYGGLNVEYSDFLHSFRFLAIDAKEVAFFCHQF